MFVIMTFACMVGWRSVFRLIFRNANGNLSSQRQVLVAGAGPVGRRLQEQMMKNPALGLSLAGFLDDNPRKRALHQDILGSIEDARRVAIDFKIDDIVIALPARAYERVNRLVAELHTLPVRVWIIPDYFNLALHKAVVEEFAGIPMLDLRAPALNDYQRMVKRAFDLIVTALSLLPGMLLMGAIALAIRLEGPGPILFKQDRVGENGRLFRMLKFRTMFPGADMMRSMVEHEDDQGHLIHKTPDDPRVTRVGRFLRRTSLDELPQLFNILRGEMSLVGPRPELPYLVEQYEPWQRKRFAVPQGITGWWQVNGRSDKPMHLNTDDDLYYVQHYSLLLDIQILLKTIGVVLRGKGAY
jgi:exopolysaccharide biosynthesis polyprenyl glycosylphosphotransferase